MKLIANYSILAGTSCHFGSDYFVAKVFEASSVFGRTCMRRGRNMRLEMRRTKPQNVKVTASLSQSYGALGKEFGHA